MQRCSFTGTKTDEQKTLKNCYSVKFYDCCRKAENKANVRFPTEGKTNRALLQRCISPQNIKRIRKVLSTFCFQYVPAAILENEEIFAFPRLQDE